MKKLLLIISGCLLLNIQSFTQSEFEFKHFNQASEPELGGNNFKAVAVSREGYIWAGSQYHGVAIFNPKDSTWESIVELGSEWITDMKTDQNGNIWIANGGRQFSQGGGSNIGGGVHVFRGDVPEANNFYTITGGGGLTSRNARSIWIDKHRSVPLSKPIAWVAQGTYVSTGTTLAGGFSIGQNEGSPAFTKGYIGLQVTPYVSAANARTPSCLAVGGNKHEVWVFAQANFSRNQLLRYKANVGPGAFLGAYDHTNTPVLTNGFRANAIYFDDQDRGWIGLQEGGIIIRVGGVWKTMNDAAVFPNGTLVNPNAITSDENGYVYFGTSSGLVIYRGGPVDVAASYRRVTTADGLPTNNINGIAIDTFAKRIILAHNAGVSFMKFRKKVDATLEWDYSLPKPATKPIGVAADGVARLYVKVRRNENTGLGIKKIALAVKNVGAAASTIVGKLKVASVLDKYSNEANEGTSMEVSRTDSTPTGDFNFWYVAPEDFSKDSLSKEAQLSEREDSIKVKVTYSDNSVDSSYISIKVQRPPLMMTSMVNRAVELLKGVKQPDNVPILLGDKIGHKIGVQMNAESALLDNVSRLIDGDLIQNEDRGNSFQGVLETMRSMGFAVNKVDFVAHGLAGNVLRATEAVKKAKFYADGDHTHNNYGKGYVNKLISVNTPHNGSPMFDMIKEMVPKLNELGRKIAQNVAGNSPAAITPYPFLNQLTTSLMGLDSSFLIVSELMKKAAMDSSSFKLPETRLKNHLMISNVEATPANPRGGTGLFGALANVLPMVMRDHFPPQVSQSLNSSFSQIGTSAGRLVQFMNKYAEGVGIADFSNSGDFIGSLTSQAAGQVLTLPHITKFTSDSAKLVTHEGILKLKDVGIKLTNLLNTSIKSSAFGDVIPANTTTVSRIANEAIKKVKVFYDTTKVVTDDPQPIENRSSGNSRSFENTTLSLKYRVKDTVGLQYIFVNFQDSMYTTTSKARNQEVKLKVKPLMKFSGMQNIIAVGVYENADSIKYHADTISTFVTPPDSLQGFRITEEEVDLFDGIPYYPNYEVKINDEWQPLASGDTAVKIVIENKNALAYDSARLAFDAANDGFSRAYFTYKTFKDTVTFDILLPLKSSAINRSIVSGNFSDSATWSKSRPPLSGDSVIISAGHSIVLNTTVQIRSLRIDSLATLTLNQSTKQLQLGDAEDGAFVLDNYGTLNISNGGLTVKGRVKFNKGSTFSMTGGSLVIDGNTGFTVTSLANGFYLFEAAPLMKLFSFTGGTLQIVDPPIGVASQAISCPYNFGPNSTLILGNGISATASNSPNGFGGPLFPPVLGRLVLDAGTPGNNRQLNITKPLNVKGSLEVKTGSRLNLYAPVTVTQ